MALAKVSQHDYLFVTDFAHFNENQPIEKLDQAYIQLIADFRPMLSGGSFTKTQWNAILYKLMNSLSHYRLILSQIAAEQPKTPEIKELQDRSLKLYTELENSLSAIMRAIQLNHQNTVRGSLLLNQSLQQNITPFRDYFNNINKRADIIMSEIKSEFGTMEDAAAHFKEEK